MLIYHKFCDRLILVKEHTFLVVPYHLLTLLIPSLFYLLVHSRCRGFVISLDHTQAHTTVGRTPLDEGSARHRDLYLTTRTLYKKNIHAPGGIRTYDPSRPTP
jgi:hypothetical protein